MKRAGVAPGAPVVALAKAIAERPGLAFRGVIGWESQAVTIADPVEKEQVVAAAIGLLTASADACRRAGYAVEIVSCGGTGTFPYCARQPGVTEVQVGGGIFSDMHYRNHYHVDFPCALTLLATVTSRPTPTRIILDAGKKSMSGDAAMPQPIGLPPVRQLRLSAEHATIELDEPQRDAARSATASSSSSAIPTRRCICMTRSSACARDGSRPSGPSRPGASRNSAAPTPSGPPRIDFLPGATSN